MKLLTTLLMLLALAAPARAQLGMGSTTPHPSAALDVQATDKAFYPPRLTTIQRKAIVNPQSGAFVYDLDKSTFYLFDGVKWLPLAFTTDSNLPTTDRTASDGAAGDQFGSSVAISDDYALVGSPGSILSPTRGSVYVFVHSGSTWTQQAKLTASDGAAYDEFGSSVSISGNLALIGAPADDNGVNTDQGSAYVFVRSGSSWTQQAKLTASDGAASDIFGTDVAISGTYALVGAFGDDAGANANQGSAYVFGQAGLGWIQTAKITALDGLAGDNFGIRVALSGDYALIGASDDDVGTNANQGSAYVFMRSGGSWIQQAKLTAADGSTSDRFGWSLAISGNYALVGAYQKRGVDGQPFQGAAYVFVRSGSSWTQQAKLAAHDKADNDVFGSSVAILGDYAVIGAPNDDIGDNRNQGSAYLYKRTGTSWLFLRKITDNAPTNTNNGDSVGISDNSFIIGGPGFEGYKGKVGFGTVDN